MRACETEGSYTLGWRQDNRNRSNQESKFDFLATLQQLGKMNGGQQKIKIVRTNRQSNLRSSYQSIFSLCWHHPSYTHETEHISACDGVESSEVIDILLSLGLLGLVSCISVNLE